MNTGFTFHISEDELEKYALGRLPNADCEPLDEHLLICPICQSSLEAMDEYVIVMKAATAALKRDGRSEQTPTTLQEHHVVSNTHGNTDGPNKGTA